MLQKKMPKLTKNNSKGLHHVQPRPIEQHRENLINYSIVFVDLLCEQENYLQLFQIECRITFEFEVISKSNHT